MWIDVVCVLAIAQFIGFAVLVGAARGKYGVHAPATSGHPMFDRIYRVQMNTLELLVAFVPALYLASRYWSADVVAAVGAVYLVGRVIYWRAYTRDPARRGLGYALSVFPVLGMLGAALVGALLAALR